MPVDASMAALSDHAIAGDAGAVLDKLLTLHEAEAPRRTGSGRREQIKRDKDAYRETWYANDAPDKVNPARFFDGLRRQMADDGILVIDDGNHTFLTAELMPIHAPKSVILPTDFNCMGYAVPGTVLALGLLSPLVSVDEILNALARGLTGVNVGLVLAGSSAALIIAYTARFSSIAIGVVQAGLTQTPREFDESARLEGAGVWPILRQIHLPLLTPALTGAALLVFVDCLKELPMTLLMRPLNVETLATSIYQFATRGSFEDGALAALLIVLAGIPPVILLMRLPDVREKRR